MVEQSRRLRLSLPEFEYLKQILLSDESFAALADAERGRQGDHVIIQISQTQAEGLREYLTSQLAARGFNHDYSPNEQGQMLEDLIDRFYFRPD
jgi:hypothetical protein